MRWRLPLLRNSLIATPMMMLWWVACWYQPGGSDTPLFDFGAGIVMWLLGFGFNMLMSNTDKLPNN